MIKDKALTWKLEFRNFSLVLTKNGEAFAVISSAPGLNLSEVTAVRDALNAAEEAK